MSKIEIINKLIDDIPENQLSDIIDYLVLLKLKNDKADIADIEAASLSGTGFWDNSDDEVWDYV